MERYIKSMRRVGANYYSKGAKDSSSLKMYGLILQILFFFLINSYVNTILYSIYVSALCKLYLFWFSVWSGLIWCYHLVQSQKNRWLQNSLGSFCVVNLPLSMPLSCGSTEEGAVGEQYFWDIGLQESKDDGRTWCWRSRATKEQPSQLGAVCVELDALERGSVEEWTSGD